MDNLVTRRDVNQFLISGELIKIGSGKSRDKGISFTNFSLRSLARGHNNLISLVAYGQTANNVNAIEDGDTVIVMGNIQTRQDSSLLVVDSIYKD